MTPYQKNRERATKLLMEEVRAKEQRLAVCASCRFWQRRLTHKILQHGTIIGSQPGWVEQPLPGNYGLCNVLEWPEKKWTVQTQPQTTDRTSCSLHEFKAAPANVRPEDLAGEAGAA